MTAGSSSSSNATVPHYCLGPKTYKVPMSMHAYNRSRLVTRMTSAGVPSHSVVLLQGGKEERRYDTDSALLFRQESYFHWCFGFGEPHAYGLIELDTGRTTLFVERLPSEYAVWLGNIKEIEEIKERYAVDDVKFTDDIEAAVAAVAKSKVYVLRGLNTDSNDMAVPAQYAGLEKLDVDDTTLFPEIVECRVIKSDAELDLMRHINNISTAAHVAVMQAAQPGMAEFELESLFLHEVYSKGGCRFTAYTCVCGSGINSSVLHYGHQNAPNDRVLADGDMCLFDMGGEYYCYSSDITCSFPASGKFSEQQKTIYNAVLAANRAVQSAMKPGVSYKDMHRLSERVLAENLLAAGILVGDIEDIVEANVPALFQPHGLGHLMGLEVHDVGGYPSGVKRSTEPGLKSLRCGRVLEAGMVVTVEPGCYFIDALLAPALADPVKSKFLNADAIARYRGFGGVRIEDDVIITASGAENMTKVPRDVADIERVMSGGEWKIM